MILQIYILTVLVSMALLTLHQSMVKNGTLKINPSEAMDKLREFLEKRPQFENILDFAMTNPKQYMLLICLFPVFNLLVCVGCIKNMIMYR